MRSKIITTVMTLAVVGPFAYVATADAVSIKQHLHEQNTQIEQLSTESVKLDKELDKTVEIKTQSQAEVEKLEQETNEVLNERQRLEAELGAN